MVNSLPGLRCSPSPQSSKCTLCKIYESGASRCSNRRSYPSIHPHHSLPLPTRLGLRIFLVIMALTSKDGKAALSTGDALISAIAAFVPETVVYGTSIGTTGNPCFECSEVFRRIHRVPRLCDRYHVVRFLLHDLTIYQ